MNRPYPFDGFPEKGSDWKEVEKVYDNVLGWLGRYRDALPPDAVSLLQDILGVPQPEKDNAEAGYSVHRVPCPYEHGGACTCDPDGKPYVHDEVANIQAKGRQAVKEAYERCAAFVTSEHLRLGKINYTGAIEALMNCHTQFHRWADQ